MPIIIIINKENLGILLISGWEFNQIRCNMKQYTVEREVHITPMCTEALFNNIS